MRIEAPRRLSRPVPLVPLIDVVFLLLMFFMLSTTFSKFGLLGFPSAAKPAAGNAAPAATSRLSGIIVDVSRGPKVRVNGRDVELGALAAALDTLEGKGSTRGVIRLRPDASVQDMLDVLEVARRSRLRALALSQ